MEITEVAQRLQDFEEQYLPFPTFVAAKNEIERHLQMFREAGLARNMLILGEAGTGKSSLCRWMMTQYPRQRLLERDQIEILHMVVPPAATMMGVADALLSSLGDPHPGRGSITLKTSRIVTLCRNCKVELLLVDEAQHLQDRGNVRTHYLVGDWFKHLIDRLAVPTVMLGLPQLQKLLETNEQLRRRFSRRIWLGLGQSDNVSIETECYDLFLALSTLLPFSVVPGSYEAQDMGSRLYYACDGRVAYIKKLLFAALRAALEGDHEVIDEGLLQRAFIEEVWSEGIGKLNPFHPDFEHRRLDRRGEPFQIIDPSTLPRKST